MQNKPNQTQSPLTIQQQLFPRFSLNAPQWKRPVKACIHEMYQKRQEKAARKKANCSGGYNRAWQGGEYQGYGGHFCCKSVAAVF